MQQPGTPVPANPASITNLPHVAANNFYHGFTTGGKRLFVALYALLVLGVVALLYFTYHPYQWVAGVQTVPEVGRQVVAVKELEANYRQVPLLAEAYHVFANYAATPIEVSLPLLVLLGVFSIAGWSAIMAASGRIDSAWVFAIYFVFALYLYAAGPAQLFFGTDPFKLLSLAVLLVFILPAFAFRNRWVVLSIPLQFAVYAALFIVYYGIAYFLRGVAGVHQLLTYNLLVQGLVVALFLIFTGRELVNFVLLLATNHADVARRRPLWLIVTIVVLLVVLQVLMLLQDFGFLPAYDAYLKPTHLLAVTLLVCVFTLQNIYHQVRSSVQVPLAFAACIIGLALLVAGTLAYCYGSAEYLVRAQTNRLILLTGAVTGGLYFIYVLLHFGQYLRAKINVYYVLMEPPTRAGFRYIAVAFIAVAFFVFVEGATHWRTGVLWLGAGSNQRADNARLRGQDTDAINGYALTLAFTQGDTKANYNLAAYRIAQNAPRTQVQDLYTHAESLAPFPYARLNHGNYLIGANRPSAAYIAFKAHLNRWPDARVLANLAALYRREGQADSAVYYLRRAIQTDASHGAIMANLARVYAENNRTPEARKFLQAALDVSPADDAVLANAAFFNLTGAAGGALPLPATTKIFADTTRDLGMRCNLLLSALAASPHGTDSLAVQTGVQTLLAQANTGETQLLQLLANLVADSLAPAQSRYQYIAQFHPAQKALAAHALAAYYHSRSVPEMAAPFFMLAAQSGLPADSLLVGYMLADAGNFDAAYGLLTRYRANHMDDYRTIGREVAILLRAFNRNELALLEWNFADITLAEALRLGIYANRAGNLATAVETYVELVKRDTATTLPYLEMGRMYQPLGDSLALIQFDAGLPRNPADFSLRLEKARSLGRLANPARRAEADKLIAALQQERPGDFDLQLLLAERHLAAKQYAAAQTLLLQLRARRPLSVAVVALLAQTYQARGNNIGGNALLTDALRANDRNATLWAWHAHFAQALDQPTEAAYARKQAETFSYTEAEKKALAAQFKSWGF
jgi:tetratricopeptide (TPR) repeat protein